MNRTGAAILTTTALALTLTSCSSPADGDQAACDTFAAGHNTMMGTVHGHAGPEAARAAITTHTAGIDEALLVAEDPGLTIGLTRAAGMVPGLGTDDDMATAYFLHAGDVFETCRGLGVDVHEATD